MDEELPQTQKEILDMYVVQGMKPKDIAERRGVSFQSVYEILKKLEQKGYIFKHLNFKGCTHTQPTPHQSTKKPNKIWRYHALEFEIRPYHWTDKYHKIMKERGNQAKVLGKWRYIMYYKKLIIWLIKGKDFGDKSKHRAIMNAQEDLNELLSKLSYRLGFKWDKDNRISIRLLKHHLAYTNAPEKDVVTEKQIRVVYDDNGMIRMLYDFSKGTFEREFVSRRAVDDSDQFDKYVLDFLDNDPPTNSELAKYLKVSLEAQAIYNENIKKHLGVLTDMSTTLKQIRITLKKRQKRITEY